ncbi:hypothetical protein SUDANB60_06022 [Streptomyces sp. enrichment culture]
MSRTLPDRRPRGHSGFPGVPSPDDVSQGAGLRGTQKWLALRTGHHRKAAGTTGSWQPAAHSADLLAGHADPPAGTRATPA